MCYKTGQFYLLTTVPCQNFPAQSRYAIQVASYTAYDTLQAKTKKGNRRSEYALREAELWGTAARTLKLSMQSDMFMALIGAVTALALLSRTHDRQIGRLR